nr:rRNA maturation RNase YbeY [Alteromonas halophila]
MVDYQQAFDGDAQLVASLPSEEDIAYWVSRVLAHQKMGTQEVTVRFVGEEESATLNGDYRDKHYPTNVLSFPFEAPPGIELNLLGDLVVCVPVICKEAREQNKAVSDHYTHMIVHGVLHLMGFDHITDAEAQEMEALEIAILSRLGIDDPYQEH